MNEQNMTADVSARCELFAAVNSGRGFESFYGEIFGRDEISVRYLIKGGPGTGKSTFMKKVAETAELAGYAVEYYKCSSDPDSLDAVVLDGRIAIMDSTAPHAEEPALPGARDRIIDLGVFWNASALADSKERITLLTAEKSACYRGAYRFLAAAMSVDGRDREMIDPYIKKEKMRRAASRAAADIPNGTGYRQLVGICGSVGMRGRVRLDTYERMAKRLVLVEDDLKCGSLFLSMLADEAIKKGNRIRVSYCPIDPSYPDAVFFEEGSVAFVLSDGRKSENALRINMRRFVDRSPTGLGSDAGRQIKRELRSNGRIISGLVQSASDCLARAGEYHFELEDIYKKSMDFKAENAFLEAFSLRMLEELRDDH